MRSFSKILVVLSLVVFVGMSATAANAGLLLTQANQIAGDTRLSDGYGTPAGLTHPESTVLGTDWGDGVTGAMVTTQGNSISATWDLGAVTALGTLSVDYMSIANNAFSPINIFLSNDGTFGATPDFSVVPADFSAWALPDPWDGVHYFASWTDNIDLTGSNARYIQVDLMNSHTDTAYGAWTGASEVSLSAGEEVPEPATIVLLAVGLLGMLAYAWRKRK